MKSNHILRIVFITATLLLALCTPALMKKGFPQSQTATSAPPKFALIEYFKIEPGKGADYRKLEQEVWVPIHRERLKQGIIKSWWAWSVRLPGGTAREYDRVIITTFNKFADVETPYPPGIFTKIFPNTTAAEIVARTGTLSKLVRSEYIQIIDAVSVANPAQPPKYASLHFIQPEPGGGYVNIARQYWKLQGQYSIHS